METPQGGPPRTYESLPVRIEAMFWDGSAECATDIIEWALDHGVTVLYWCPCEEECSKGASAHVLRIPTLEGPLDVESGAWVIKGTEGEFYPCKESVFQRKYTEVWN